MIAVNAEMCVRAQDQLIVSALRFARILEVVIWVIARTLVTIVMGEPGEYAYQADAIVRQVPRGALAKELALPSVPHPYPPPRVPSQVRPSALVAQCILPRRVSGLREARAAAVHGPGGRVTLHNSRVPLRRA